MVKTSAWGTRRFQKGNAEDEAVKRSIYHKLLDLGEDPNEKISQLKPEEIHKMDKSWQPYSADSFGKVVRALRKIIKDGGDRDALDDEEDVVPPSKANRATTRQPFFSFGGRAYNDADEEEEAVAGDEDSNEFIYGSNEGIVQLPYVFVKVTHPPEGDETGRTKKVHLIVHLISGSTHAKMGYSVSCPPKGNHIIIAHQKGLENVFWGPTGRAMVPAGVAQDQMTLACAAMTTNFTLIPRQEQQIEFPFALERILKKKPFFVNTGNGPGQQFLGLYICAKVDWTDVEAEGAGDDYVELRSPDAKHMSSGNAFYSTGGSAARSTSNGRGYADDDDDDGDDGDEFPFANIGGKKSKAGRNTDGSIASAAGGGDDFFTDFEERLARKLLARMNIRGDINGVAGDDGSQEIAKKKKTASVINRSSRLASCSKALPPVMVGASTTSVQGSAASRRVVTGGGGSSGGSRIMTKENVSMHEVTATTGATTNVDDLSGVSFDVDIEDVEEVYNCFPLGHTNEE